MPAGTGQRGDAYSRSLRRRHPSWTNTFTQWPEFVTTVLAQDLVVHKKRMNAFFASDLDFLLRNTQKTTIVITGIFTDACDLSTAFAAADLDYNVVVPRDIVTESSEEMEHCALSIVSLYLGLVVESSDLVEQWQRALEPAAATSSG